MLGKNRARTNVLAVAAAGAVAFAACGGGGGGGGGGGNAGGGGGGGGGAAAGGGGKSTQIELTTVDNAFQPKTLKVPAGAKVTVTVTNDGQAPHTFTSEELGFDSGTIEPGASKKVTFTAPDSGSTEYICEFHASAGMTGDISTG